MTDLAVARMGLADMAVTRCVAGTALNLLVGTGVCMIRSVVEKYLLFHDRGNSGTTSFGLKSDPSLVVLVGIIFAAVAMGIQLGTNMKDGYDLARENWDRFILSKYVAMGGIAVYAGFVVVIIVVAAAA